jgi:DNA polymerase III subunit beta
VSQVHHDLSLDHLRAWESMSARNVQINPNCTTPDFCLCTFAEAIQPRGEKIMFVSVMQEQLKRALATAKLAVGGKKSPELTKAVHLRADDGVLTLTTTDLERAITTTIGAKITQSGATVLNHADLQNTVKSLSPERLDLDVRQPHQAKIMCGIAESTLRTTDPNEWATGVLALNEVEFPHDASVDAEAFKTAILQVERAVAGDDMRPILTGIFMRFQADTLTLAAADGYRLHVKTLPIAYAGERREFVVPADSLRAVAKIIEAVMGKGKRQTPFRMDISLPTETRRWVSFHAINTRLDSQLLDGKFPPFESIIPRDHLLSSTVYAEDMARALERIVTMQKGNDYTSVNLTFEADTIRLYAKSENALESRHMVDAAHRGESLERSYNSRYLLDAVRAILPHSERAVFLPSKSPLLIQPEGDDSFMAIVMPMSVRNPTPTAPQPAPAPQPEPQSDMQEGEISPSPQPAATWRAIKTDAAAIAALIPCEPLARVVARAKIASTASFTSGIILTLQEADKVLAWGEKNAKMGSSGSGAYRLIWFRVGDTLIKAEWDAARYSLTAELFSAEFDLDLPDVLAMPAPAPAPETDLQEGEISPTEDYVPISESEIGNIVSWLETRHAAIPQLARAAKDLRLIEGDHYILRMIYGMEISTEIVTAILAHFERDTVIKPITTANINSKPYHRFEWTLDYYALTLDLHYLPVEGEDRYLLHLSVMKRAPYLPPTLPEPTLQEGDISPTPEPAENTVRPNSDARGRKRGALHFPGAFNDTHLIFLRASVQQPNGQIGVGFYPAKAVNRWTAKVARAFQEVVDWGYLYHTPIVGMYRARNPHRDEMRSTADLPAPTLQEGEISPSPTTVIDLAAEGMEIESEPVAPDAAWKDERESAEYLLAHVAVRVMMGWNRKAGNLWLYPYLVSNADALHFNPKQDRAYYAVDEALRENIKRGTWHYVGAVNEIEGDIYERTDRSAAKTVPEPIPNARVELRHDCPPLSAGDQGTVRGMGNYDRWRVQFDRFPHDIYHVRPDALTTPLQEGDISPHEEFGDPSGFYVRLERVGEGGWIVRTHDSGWGISHEHQARLKFNEEKLKIQAMRDISPSPAAVIDLAAEGMEIESAPISDTEFVWQGADTFLPTIAAYVPLPLAKIITKAKWDGEMFSAHRKPKAEPFAEIAAWGESFADVRGRRNYTILRFCVHDVYVQVQLERIAERSDLLLHMSKRDDQGGYFDLASHTLPPPSPTLMHIAEQVPCAPLAEAIPHCGMEAERYLGGFILPEGKMGEIRAWLETNGYHALPDDPMRAIACTIIVKEWVLTLDAYTHRLAILIRWADEEDLMNYRHLHEGNILPMPYEGARVEALRPLNAFLNVKAGDLGVVTGRNNRGRWIIKWERHPTFAAGAYPQDIRVLPDAPPPQTALPCFMEAFLPLAPSHVRAALENAEQVDMYDTPHYGSFLLRMPIEGGLALFAWLSASGIHVREDSFDEKWRAARFSLADMRVEIGLDKQGKLAAYIHVIKGKDAAQGMFAQRLQKPQFPPQPTIEQVRDYITAHAQGADENHLHLEFAPYEYVELCLEDLYEHEVYQGEMWRVDTFTTTTQYETYEGARGEFERLVLEYLTTHPDLLQEERVRQAAERLELPAEAVDAALEALQKGDISQHAPAQIRAALQPPHELGEIIEHCAFLDDNDGRQSYYAESIRIEHKDWRCAVEWAQGAGGVEIADEGWHVVTQGYDLTLYHFDGAVDVRIELATPLCKECGGSGYRNLWDIHPSDGLPPSCPACEGTGRV